MLVAVRPNTTGDPAVVPRFLARLDDILDDIPLFRAPKRRLLRFPGSL